MKWVWWVLLSSPLWLAAGAILLNRPPLFDEPGMVARLRIYLATNVAETRPGHELPELCQPVFAQAPGALRDRLRQVMSEMGWRKVREEDGVIRAEVVTPLWRFTDDIEARVEQHANGSLLHLRSASRVGKADFAANQRHLLDLIERLDPASRL